MTQGILLFAHDNEQIQYSLLAAWQARRIHKWLDKPVSIVTDANSLNTLKQYNLDHVFDHIILSDADTTQQKRYTDRLLTFKNINRTDAYELTPYDETLLMDIDIVIQSDRLNLVWNNQDDYLVCKNCKDVTGQAWPELDYIHPRGIKFYWATLFYFKKTPTSKQFFDACKHVKEHYPKYKEEYGIKDQYLRNDHVWSIVIHLLGGLDIPTNLWYSVDQTALLKMSDDTVAFKQAKIQGQDVHVMDKFSLMACVKKELGCE
jgi:hypothetical protein